MINMHIPLVDLKANYHSMKREIDDTIRDVIENSAFIMGEHVKEFDKRWAAYCHAKHALGLSNGTEAVRLAVKACDIGKGDEVITVPNTFIATTESISDNGAQIVFVDVDSRTHTIDVTKIEDKITPNTKAIICVHLYGHPCDMDPIMDIARRHHLKVIEDCAQAHGAKYKGRMVGTIGDIGCWSMFPAKILGAYGDAGAVTTNDDELARKLSLYRDHGRISKYESIIEGYNSRIDALQAAILNAKLAHLDMWIAARRRIAKQYSENLKGVIVPEELSWAMHPYYMYVIQSEDRERLMEYLKKNGISTGIHYPIPLHLQPAYSYLGHKKGDFPISEELCSKVVSIPLYPEMTDEQTKYVIEKINSFS